MFFFYPVEMRGMQEFVRGRKSFFFFRRNNWWKNAHTSQKCMQWQHANSKKFSRKATQNFFFQGINFLWPTTSRRNNFGPLRVLLRFIFYICFCWIIFRGNKEKLDGKKSSFKEKSPPSFEIPCNLLATERMKRRKIQNILELKKKKV